MASICIVSTAHPSHNPRVVKEADALVEAGHRVRLVTCQYSAQHAEWDATLLATRGWSMDAVRLQRSPAAAIGARLQRNLALRLAQVLGIRPGLGEILTAPDHFGLARLAAQHPAQLFIAHTPGALGAAAAAARTHRAALGFDAEDLHSGERPASEHHTTAHLAVCAIEARYLPRCAYVTAASRPMAERLAERHRIPTPVVVHNVFEWAERSRLDGKRLDRSSVTTGNSRAPVSVYWFSQVVGLDRGLQDLLRAAGQVRGAVEVHIRGELDPAVGRALREIAQSNGFVQHLHFHEKVPPGELLSRTVEHDVGAALELPVSENRELTVTNKLFLYALGGLSLLATDTRGQRSVMASMPDAGSLFKPGDVAALAAHLQALVDSPERLAAQRAASLRHVQQRLCWEVEKHALLDAVQRALSSHAR